MHGGTRCARGGKSSVRESGICQSGEKRVEVACCLPYPVGFQVLEGAGGVHRSTAGGAVGRTHARSRCGRPSSFFVLSVAPRAENFRGLHGESTRAPAYPVRCTRTNCFKFVLQCILGGRLPSAQVGRRPPSFFTPVLYLRIRRIRNNYQHQQ